MRGKKRVGLLLMVALLIGAVAAPASATKPKDPDLVAGHKIWICHATSSLSNPYVKILIDIAAWDVDDPDSNDHGPLHHLRTKKGITWGDYALGDDPTAECALTPPPPPEKGVCPGTDQEVDYVVTFYNVKLRSVAVHGGTLATQTVPGDIPAGSYDVILISGDYARGSRNGLALVQPHEQWRLAGTIPSGWSNDLLDTVADITGQVTSGLGVTFGGDITSITAEHYSVVPTNSQKDDSVVPEYACLTAKTSSAN